MVRDVQDLVRYGPGITVAKTTAGTDPFGNLAGFTLRGVSNNRVQMLIDGTRVIESIVDGNRVNMANLKSGRDHPRTGRRDVGCRCVERRRCLRHQGSGRLPQGPQVRRPADLAIGKGDTVWLSGSSGLGRSTLLKALAGWWRFGEGCIELSNGHLCLMPQQAYMLLAPLVAAATGSSELC